MSVYNGEKYLNEAIDSILRQTFENFEFIIINDGSTDKSIELIKSYSDNRICLIDQQNTGLAIALNRATNVSKGKYIARMDADDISLPNRLELQFSFLEAHGECVAVGGNAIIIDEGGAYIYPSAQKCEWEEIRKQLPSTPFFHSSTMFRKSSFDEVKGYPEIYRIEDAVFFNKLSQIGELRNLPNILIKYRLVPNAITTKSSRSDSMIIDKILRDFVQGKSTDYQNEMLRILTINRGLRWKSSLYHLHLAKKYLWNNYQPKLARKNLRKSLLLQIRIFPALLYLATFINGKILKKIYILLK